MRNYNNLIDALESRADDISDKGHSVGLDAVLLEDAADAIKVLTGQRHLDRLLSNGTSDRLTQTLDRLLFIQNVMDHDPGVSLQWIYTEIEALLSGDEA